MLLYRRDKCEFHGKRLCKDCRCPKCKLGFILEWHYWFCSRAYARKSPCDYWSNGERDSLGRVFKTEEDGGINEEEEVQPRRA